MRAHAAEGVYGLLDYSTSPLSTLILAYRLRRCGPKGQVGVSWVSLFAEGREL